MAVKISQRAAAMPASPIRKLAPYADAAKARGVKVFHLNIGQPDVPSPDLFWDAIKHADLKVLEYSNSAGIIELREKAAAKYADYGIHVKTEDLIVTTAGSEALSIAIATICDPGDEVIVPEPMYANYIGFAAAYGVNVVPLPTKIEDGFALPSPEEFAKVVTPKTRAIVVCNPNNPTGTVYSEDQLDALRIIVQEHNLFLIADEVYRDFVYEGPTPKSVLNLEGIEDRAIMVDSVSKRFSLCGARIGFLVCRNAEFMAAAVRFAQARLSAPTLEMVGVLAALDTPPEYFQAVREEYRARRDLLVSRLRAIPGVVCPDIQGAFYATTRLPVDDCDSFAQWLLESFTHDGKTVMAAPASGFYSTPGSGKQEMRFAYVLNLQDLAEAMDCLEAALAAYPGRLSPASANS